MKCSPTCHKDLHRELDILVVYEGDLDCMPTAQTNFNLNCKKIETNSIVDEERTNAEMIQSIEYILQN